MSPHQVRIRSHGDGAERRRHPREAARVLATISIGSQELHGAIENVSAGGVLFSSFAVHAEIEVGDLVILSLDPHGSHVEIRRDARVVRAEVRSIHGQDRFLYALEFLDDLSGDNLQHVRGGPSD